MSTRPLHTADLPDITITARDNSVKKAATGVPIILILTFLIGWGLAEFVYNFSSSKGHYDIKITILRGYDLHWLYFSAVVLSRLTVALNMLPTVWKSAIMLRSSGNLRANMYIYKVSQPSDADGDSAYPQLGHVLLDESGDTGKYNRANRSLHHYTENLGGFFLAVPLASFVFPEPSFILVLVFAVGRLWHMYGYAAKGYGAHAPGFGMAMIAGSMIEGLLFVAALRSAGAFA